MVERDPENDPELQQLAAEIVVLGAAPAAVVGVAQREPAGFSYHWGAAGTLWPAASNSVDAESIFDLASLTKVPVAWTAAMAMAEGLTAPSVRLGELLPELKDTRAAFATLETLMSHRAGLLPHLPLFDTWQSGRAIRRKRWLRRAANGTREGSCARGSEAHPPVYSDLSYILLGAALEVVFGEPLETTLRQRIVEPFALEFGSARTLWRTTQSFRARVVPSEVVSERGGLLRGVVHDENAWALTGHGMSGHAGAFGTVRAVLGLGTAMLDAEAGHLGRLCGDSIRFVIAPRPGGSLCAGVDRRSAGKSVMGERASPSTFGHLGFTGTSLFCDPERQTVISVLSNRVCPSRENTRLRSLRPSLHDRLFSWSDRRFRAAGKPKADGANFSS